MANAPISKVNIRKMQLLILISEKLLDDNWVQWKKEIMGFFELCELLLMINGTLSKSNADNEPQNSKAWLFNN